MSALAFTPTDHHFSAKPIDQLTVVSVNLVPNQAQTIQSTSSGKKKSKSLESSIAENEEENKSISLSSFTKNSGYTLRICHEPVLGFFNQDLKRSLRSCEQSDLRQSDNHLFLFQGLRI